MIFRLNTRFLIILEKINLLESNRRFCEFARYKHSYIQISRAKHFTSRVHCPWKAVWVDPSVTRDTKEAIPTRCPFQFPFSEQSGVSTLSAQEAVAFGCVSRVLARLSKNVHASWSNNLTNNSVIRSLCARVTRWALTTIAVTRCNAYCKTSTSRKLENYCRRNL